MKDYIKDGLAIYQLTDAWADMTHKVLCFEELPVSEMQELIAETYEVLNLLRKEKAVPKELCKMFLNMDRFLHFSADIEEREMGKGFYHWEEYMYIIESMTKGFFKSEYQAEYPKLVVTDYLDNSFLIDFDKDNLENYFSAVQSTAAGEE